MFVDQFVEHRSKKAKKKKQLEEMRLWYWERCKQNFEMVVERRGKSSRIIKPQGRDAYILYHGDD